MATPSRCDGADRRRCRSRRTVPSGRLAQAGLKEPLFLYFEYFERISCVAARGGARPVYLQKLDPVPPRGDKSGSNRESNFRKIQQPQRLR